MTISTFYGLLFLGGNPAVYTLLLFFFGYLLRLDNEKNKKKRNKKEKPENLTPLERLNLSKEKEALLREKEALLREKEDLLKRIIKHSYNNNKEKADALITYWNEENSDYKFTDNHINRRLKKYKEKMKLKEEKAKERQRIRDEKDAKRKAHKAKLAKAKKARKEKIYNFLKLEGGKIPASDIDFQLKFKNIDKTKNECEEMYKSGKIGRTGNYRYFV